MTDRPDAADGLAPSGRINAPLPARSGAAAAPDVDPDPAPWRDRIPSRSFLARASMADLQGDFRLFSLAPLFALGRLTSDPVADWENETGRRGASGVLLLQKPVLDLTRLPPVYQRFDPAAAHVLRFVQAELWEELFSRLGRVSGFNRQDKFFWRAVAQLVPLPDYRAAERSAGAAAAVAPTSPVVLFGLDSNDGLFHWGEPAAGQRPPLLKSPPEPETVALAEALFGGET